MTGEVNYTALLIGWFLGVVAGNAFWFLVLDPIVDHILTRWYNR